ncbi:hypothetical protein GOODEAATRI_021683 [Goodea atripinnis]|uniref:DM14 domain-containing protein n=1 Tax=Goodea atripinnis TaxID=208336 RepID=A0ABV0NQJ9_9TELE
MAAIQAKQGGDIDLAKQHYLTAKVTQQNQLEQICLHKTDRELTKDASSVIVEAQLAGGGCGPRGASGAERITSPSCSVAEALKQRMDIYKQAADGAKSKGDDRKARMHQRIIKVATLSSFQRESLFFPPMKVLHHAYWG